MSNENETFQVQRRTLLKTVAGLIAGGVLVNMVDAQDTEVKNDDPENNPKNDPQDDLGVDPRNDPRGMGKPGDFDFLAGEWTIKNRRRKPEAEGWDEFDGEATCMTVLGGGGSIEDLRIPARDFAGVGIRLLDVEKGVWSDFFVNGKNGILSTPGQTGNFKEGVGTFTSDWMEGDQKMLVKGVWDQITPTSCRWYQAVSKDAGATWEENWVMQWTRIRN